MHICVEVPIKYTIRRICVGSDWWPHSSTQSDTACCGCCSCRSGWRAFQVDPLLGWVYWVKNEDLSRRHSALFTTALWRKSLGTSARARPVSEGFCAMVAYQWKEHLIRAIRSIKN